MTDADRLTVQKLCINSMSACPFNEDEGTFENGHEFNKYFFLQYPQLRSYNGTLEEVQNSERFRRQSRRFLFSIHVCVKIFDNEALFHSYVYETVNRHRQFRLKPELWTAFWKAWMEFLENKTKFDNNTRHAWSELAEEFARVALHYAENN